MRGMREKEQRGSEGIRGGIRGRKQKGREKK